MAIVATDNKYYSAIAAAIREKNGKSDLYTPAQMADAILALSGSSGGWPVGYTRLEYIKSTGEQGFDTGVKGTSTLVSQLKFRMTAETGDVIYGYHPGSDQEDYRMFNHLEVCYLDLPGGSDAVGNRIFGGTMAVGVFHEVEIGNFYVKNLTTGSNIVSGKSVSFADTPGTIKMWLNDSNQGKSMGELCYLRQFDGSELLHNYIPARRESDGAVGLFDQITGTFGVSCTGVPFIAGPDFVN